jgi:hypothetical protein
MMATPSSAAVAITGPNKSRVLGVLDDGECSKRDGGRRLAGGCQGRRRRQALLGGLHCSWILASSDASSMILIDCTKYSDRVLM